MILEAHKPVVRYILDVSSLITAAVLKLNPKGLSQSFKKPHNSRNLIWYLSKQSNKTIT